MFVNAMTPHWTQIEGPWGQLDVRGLNHFVVPAPCQAGHSRRYDVDDPYFHVLAGGYVVEGDSRLPGVPERQAALVAELGRRDNLAWFRSLKSEASCTLLHSRFRERGTSGLAVEVLYETVEPQLPSDDIELPDLLRPPSPLGRARLIPLIERYHGLVHRHGQRGWTVIYAGWVEGLTPSAVIDELLALVDRAQILDPEGDRP